jgi:hypothetical protein
MYFSRLRLQAIVAFLAVLILGFCWLNPVPARAGDTGEQYSVLEPITQGNLTIFPVVARTDHDTSTFISLDDGIRSGEVVVTEAGQVRPLIRGPHPPQTIPYQRSGAQVNKLVLVNNSKRPLILLAGEIVTGGKQDRIIAKDRIIPAGGEPIDLSVFCVEPGRWSGSTAQFGAMKVPQMAQPKLRFDAMAAKNQQKVWDDVRSSSETVTLVADAAPVQTTSYASTMQDGTIQKKVDSVASPMERSYDSAIRKLRERHAVGVVVAVGGEIIWADIFASSQLLQKYWPKLVRSYATEAITTDHSEKSPGIAAAEEFLRERKGDHESSESEPGIYRQAEIVGANYRWFTLSSLLPGTGFDLHISKMLERRESGWMDVTKAAAPAAGK